MTSKNLYQDFFRSILNDSPTPNLSGLSFDETIGYHFNMYLIKNWASLDSNRNDNKKSLLDPAYGYVSLTADALFKANAAIDSGRLVIRQIDNPPPRSWLKQLQIKESHFLQHLLDIGTVFIYSTFDRALILTNAVLSLGFEEKLCTYKNIKTSLKRGFPDTLNVVTKFKKTADSLADPRNYLLHRGVSRTLKTFSAVHRAQILIDLLKMPTEGIRLRTSEAKWDLQKTLRDDLTSIENEFSNLKINLLTHFQSKINVLGGLLIPSKDEILRFLDTVGYFSGGQRPEWLPVEETDSPVKK